MRIQTIITGITLALTLAAYSAMAGSMTPPPGGPSAGSGMPTTKAIFQQLSSGQNATSSSSFQGPSAGPGGSGRSIKEIAGKLPVADNVNGATAGDVKAGRTFWGLKDGAWGVQKGTSHVQARICKTGWSGVNCDVCKGTMSNGVCSTERAEVVNKTGQTVSYAPGDDGYYQYGIDPAIAPTLGVLGAYNAPPFAGTRFTDNGNGTVTDNLTGLVWLKSDNCFGMQQWASALTSANTLKGDNSQCSLNDGSTPGQWRLPNINELHSLGQTWPPGTPFTAVQGNVYWSSSTNAGNAWYVNMYDGYVFNGVKFSTNYVWPVRAGQ